MSSRTISDAAVERAAEALASDADGWWNGMPDHIRNTWRKRARVALEAASAPAWPTDETVLSVWRPETSLVDEIEVARERVRAALLTDPIIKAAIELERSVDGPAYDTPGGRVIKAVRGAGL